MNKNFLYPSFDTIAGSKNGAIVHYRANKKNCKIIERKIFLCDSGGYKYGRCD